MVNDMKLGDALNRRADLKARIQQLPGRLAASAVVQEGDAPAEDPAALLDELAGAQLDNRSGRDVKSR
jgi:hypothetical protein